MFVIPRLGVVILLSLGVAKGQSSQVFALGITTVQTAENGLGFNINPQQPWQLSALSSAGARWWRMQCNWSEVERQTAPPQSRVTSPRYVQSKPCVDTYQAAARYPDLHPSVVAGYGPPYHQILTVQLTSAGKVGDISLNVVLVSNVSGDTLSSITPIRDHINDLTTLHTSPSYGVISAQRAYAGDIITSVAPIDATHATLHLGSALSMAIPTTDTLEIMEDEYIGITDNSPTNPSAVAYGNYANFLAFDMAARSFSGFIELWNEPPWHPDPWDAIQFQYDYVVSGDFRSTTAYGLNSVVFESTSNRTPYISLSANNKGNDPASSPSYWSATIPSDAYVGTTLPFPTWGLIANIMTRSWPEGVHATASSGSGSGARTPLAPDFQRVTGLAFTEPSQTVTTEAFHPYCGPYCNPEESLTSPACIQAASVATSSPDNDPYKGATCYVPGTGRKGNLMTYFLENDQQKNINPRYGIAGDITETNDYDSGYAGELVQDGKGNVRHFLGFEGNGINPVMFYEMCSGIGTGGPGANGSITGMSNGTNTITLTAATGYTLAYVASNQTFILTKTSTGTRFVIEGGNVEFISGTNVPANSSITATNYSSGVYTITLNQTVPAGTTTFAIKSWDPTIGFVTTPSGSCYFSPYVSKKMYPLNAEVTESSTDSTPYVSLQPNNVGHDPATSPTWWTSKGVYSPTPAYSMLSGVIADLAPISRPPVRNYASSDLPSVNSYYGTYPLGTVYMVGARSRATANSVAMFIYQLSECTTAVHCWSTLPAPAGSTAQINLAPGTMITSATDVVTRKAVPYAISERQVTFLRNVSDNPIELVIDPASRSLGLHSSSVGHSRDVH